MAIFRRRRIEDRALTRATLPDVMLPEPSAAVVGPTSAMRIGDAFACVRVLADSAASLPLIAYRRTEQGRVRAGGQAQDLIDAPAPATTTASLVGQLMAHLNWWGNAFLGKYRDDDGRVVALGLLAPEAVSVKLVRGEPVYTVMAAEGVSNHTAADVLHVRAPLSADGLLGLSPIRQGRDVLGLSRALTDHATATMLRGARLSGVLTTPKDVAIDPDEIDTIRAQIEGSWVGDENAGRIAFITGGLGFTQLSMPLSDAQFVEQRQLSAQEIARIFRVPPWMIGAPSGDSMTYSNVEAQAQAFVTFSLRPWLVAIEQAFTSDADLSVGTVYFEFLLDGLLRADSKTRAEIYALALDPERGWMTREEIRRLENLDPEAGA